MKDYSWALRRVPDVFFRTHCKRSVSAPKINSYNFHLLQCFQSSTDLWTVLDACACVSYLVSYFSKEETAVSEALKSTVKQMGNKNSDYKQTLRKIAVEFLNSGEVSLQGAVYRALPNLWLRKILPKVVLVNTNQVTD